MTHSISARRTASLVGDFDRSPAYAGLAHALRLLVRDGRIPHDTRLPSERELTTTLRVSRTTVTRAYAALREEGYAVARRGAGTFTQLPGGPSRAPDRVLTPRAVDPDAQADLIDLNCAAAPAPPGIAAAYEEALGELPGYLAGHGYYPAGLPELRRAIAADYARRGLPTEPEQIMVTPGALAAAAVTMLAETAPGDRVLVETPSYPNVLRALGTRSARMVTTAVDEDGWDLPGVVATVRRSAARAAYLVPDFQNPTGHLMPDDQRAAYAAALARSRTLAVVDEAHQALNLDDVPTPLPFAAHSDRAGGRTVTLGSASKMLWGGLRLGWLRAPADRMDVLVDARLTLDLGTPVLEQLVLARLLADRARIVDGHRAALREQRDRLVAALHRHLPDWRFRVPAGGLAVWCELPTPVATAVTVAAEDRGVVLAPGPVFAVEGGYPRHLRIPYTRPAAELEEAVVRLAAAWHAGQGDDVPTPGRVMVA